MNSKFKNSGLSANHGSALDFEAIDEAMEETVVPAGTAATQEGVCVRKSEAQICAWLSDRLEYSIGITKILEME